MRKLVYIMGRVFIRTACALLVLYDAQNFIFLTLNGKSRIENILCSGKTYAFFFEDNDNWLQL